MSRDRNGIGTGIVLITIGLIFLADRQGYGGFDRLWPLILIALGATRMLFPRDGSMDGDSAGRSRGCRGNRFNGLWLVIVGGIFLMSQNHVLGLRESWPLFIVAAGLAIIFGGLTRHRETDPNRGDQTIDPGGR